MRGSEEINRLVAAVLAKAPEWVRRQLSSKDPADRLRAEETLAAMIAAALADSAGPSPS